MHGLFNHGCLIYGDYGCAWRRTCFPRSSSRPCLSHSRIYTHVCPVPLPARACPVPLHTRVCLVHLHARACFVSLRGRVSVCKISPPPQQKQIGDKLSAQRTLPRNVHVQMSSKKTIIPKPHVSEQPATGDQHQKTSNKERLEHHSE